MRIHEPIYDTILCRPSTVLVEWLLRIFTWTRNLSFISVPVFLCPAFTCPAFSCPALSRRIFQRPVWGRLQWIAWMSNRGSHNVSATSPANTVNCSARNACNATHGVANARPFCLSLSVCLSVCQTCGLWQNERNLCPHSYTTWKIIQPSFLKRRMVGEILRQTNPLEWKRRFSIDIRS